MLPKLKEKFPRKEGMSLGLDIGNATLKLVKLKFSKDAFELSDFSLIPAQPDLSQSLTTLVQSQHIKTVNTSLCGPMTIIRYINLPKMADTELKKSLKFEAQKYIPFSLSEINLDAVILKPDLADNKMLVALAAVKKDFLSQRLSLLTEAGLKVNLLELDSLALINAFNFNYPQSEINKPKSIALLNIGSTFSNLNILEDGIPLLSRDISIAGNNFTQKIADSFSIDFKSAQDLKLNPDKEKITAINQVTESVVANLANEIRVSFDYYESLGASSVEKIFLSGGGSQFFSLKDTLVNLLGLEVDYWDVLRKINLSPNIDPEKLRAASSSLAVAVGLGLRP